MSLFDQELERRLNREHTKWAMVTFLYNPNGFAIEYYHLPFDKDIMNNDIDKHISRSLINILPKNNNRSNILHDLVAEYNKYYKTNASIKALTETYIEKTFVDYDMRVISKGILELINIE